MSQPLPHIFTPSERMLRESAAADHPTGPLEMFMVSCNIETDMKMDARLAQTDYKPKLRDVATKEIKQEAKHFPFSVPLVAVKSEPA